MQDHLPWSQFFNVESIKETTPIVELHEFFQSMLILNLFTKFFYYMFNIIVNGLRPLDTQVTLQNFDINSYEEYPDFSDKWEVANCKGHIQTEFWNLKNLTYTKSLCISFQGISTLLVDIIEQLQPR